MNHEAIKQELLAEGKAMGLKKGEITVLSTDPYFVDSEWGVGNDRDKSHNRS